MQVQSKHDDIFLKYAHLYPERQKINIGVGIKS